MKTPREKYMNDPQYHELVNALEHFIERTQFTPSELREAAVLAYYNEVFPAALGFTVAVRETYVTRKNVMTGREFKERYDTPYFCSPSSESFWTA